LCAEEAAAQEQTGQVEECLKVNLLKIKTEMCKKVKEMWRMSSERHLIPALDPYTGLERKAQGHRGTL